MQGPDPHDLSDDSDYAAAINSSSQVSRSMSRMDSTKSNASDGSGNSEIVFLKDNVAIHPTQYTSERISGRLRLLLRDSELFLSWIPYKPGNERSDSMGHSSPAGQFDKGRSLYTIKAVPVSDLHSIRRHTPALNWPYIIVVTSSGLAFPPFYFYSGGLREFLAALKQHVSIVRSADDANVFLVNDFQDPLQKTLSSLELPGVVSVANRPLHNSVSSVSSVDSLHINDGVAYNGPSGIINHSGRNRNKSHDPARDISIQVLEKFSLVTRFARETTSQLFGDNHTDSYSAYEKKHDSYHNNSVTDKLENEPKTSDATSVPPDPLELEKLPFVWGKQRMQPLSVQEWSAFLDAEGRILDSKALRERIFYGGVEHGLRKEVWKFLLGYHEYDSTYAERDYLVAVKKSEYEVVKSQWKSISAEQAKQFTKFRERKGLIDKDVVRTDRSVAYYEGDDNPNVTVLRDILLTYCFYNFDLGYCQGMSDFLAPILYVMEDESESFWCFVALMKRLGPNFNRDQSGMHSQLFALSKLVELLDIPLHNYLKQSDSLNYFFCFRWILIQFKREFEYDEIMLLWEVLWTHHLSEHFHLYVCVAILKMYRKKIIGEQMGFDTLLKFINELSGQIDLEQTIRDAEALCVYSGDNGAACIPPGTPASLPIETDHRLYSLEDDVL